ncbi:unnamed protein product [Rotaria sp. Silwood1]|nr:unnamed protein product [Rotaria sp. Silwood1]
MTIKTYLINKINSQKHRLNGILPSNSLPSKSNLCKAFHDNILYTPDQLPPKVDLRKDMTSVEDQSKIGSCAANALAGAYEYLTKKHNGRNTDVSRLFIYYNARAKNKKFGSVTDSGCSMESAIEALEEFGTCLESIWTYDISKVNTRPNDQAYRDAKNHTISEAFKVDIDLFEMKSCLAQGYPFAFGLRLYSSFDKAAETGLVPMPNALESYPENLGDNQGYQQNWDTNQFDQQNWTNNQFNQQTWSPNQFSQPSQQPWGNNQLYQHHDENNQPGQQTWDQNQFGQPNWNSNQFSGGNNQFDQQTLTYNQFGQQNWGTNQLDLQSQQHWNSGQFYQPNQGNNPLSQEAWSNNQWAQQNQPQWSNNQYGQTYGDGIFRGDTFGNQYPGDYGGGNSTFSGFTHNNPTSNNHGFG